MKVAHFAVFSPNASGQYATVKDLILAERRAGIDAQFIDFGYEKKPASREGLVDGDIKTAPLVWAFANADIVIRHSDVPVEIFDAKPVLFALHGRPENSFRLEQYGAAPIISTLISAAKSGKYKAFFTFWEEHIHCWSALLPSEKVYCVPSPIDLDEYTVSGEKFDFGKHSGDPNIIITDRWREDTTPFNLVYAAQYFKEHFCPTAKLHIYGVPTKKTCINYLHPLQVSGLMGQVSGLVKGLDKVYRSADMLLTPNIIATRVVREAMASGLPIVAPNGCRYTPYTAEPRDHKEFARAIRNCYDDLGSPEHLKIRKRAIEEFNLDITGLKMKEFCETILNGGGSGHLE